MTLTHSAPERRRQLTGWLAVYRRRTRALVDALGDDDLHRQHDPLMSPLVWDVGHVANFEEWWLLREVGGRPSMDPALDALYDPTVNPRAARGDLALPRRAETLAYMETVRQEAEAVLAQIDFDPAVAILRDGFVASMVAQHEAQHQETMLQALDLRPDLDARLPRTFEVSASIRSPARVDDEARVFVPGGPFTMGTDDFPDAYDNERPAHVVATRPFAIDRYPVTNRRYAAFVAAGGYSEPRWWSDDGWAWLAESGHGAPQGWQPDGAGGWTLRRFGHWQPLDPREPVTHVSYWEAEAFARWAGGRLPSEAEWEKAARWDPAHARSRPYPWGDGAPTARRANLDVVSFGPAPVGSFPDGASALGVEQLVGDVYEWTSSDFTPYPGFASFPYEEYSAPFFDGRSKVLRGASWATAAIVARATFRNWDFPQRRQIFSGVRVAYDVSPDRTDVSPGRL